MYKEEELYKKVEGHLKPHEINLLKALVADVNDFNKKYCNKLVELYIDFEDICGDGEFDPYETFSIRFHKHFESELFKYEPIVNDCMTLHDLDYSLCTLCSYFDELEECKKIVNQNKESN